MSLIINQRLFINDVLIQPEVTLKWLDKDYIWFKFNDTMVVNGNSMVEHGNAQKTAEKTGIDNYFHCQTNSHIH